MNQVTEKKNADKPVMKHMFSVRLLPTNNNKKLTKQKNETCRMCMKNLVHIYEWKIHEKKMWIKKKQNQPNITKK